MREYIIRISKNNKPFREIFIEAVDELDAIQQLDKEHRRFFKEFPNITSNLYEIKWIEGI